MDSPAAPPATPGSFIAPPGTQAVCRSAFSMDTLCGSNGSRKSVQLRQLPTTLQLHVLSFLPSNDRALSGRLVSPDARDTLSGPEHCTAFLSQPLPPHAVPWAVEAGQQHVRQLPFRHKLQLLCTAAASGSEVNLEVALVLLQPSIFPELLHSYDLVWAYMCVSPTANAGVAAVAAGHPQLLGWLLSHCPGLVHPYDMLEVAAWHCDLPGLQAVWQALQSHPSCASTCTSTSHSLYRPRLHRRVLDAAANSPTPDTVAKMEWLLATSNGGCWLSQNTAAAAASSPGYLSRLRWLREQGCPMGSEGFVQCVLENAHLPALRWLVEEAGCELLVQGGKGSSEEEEEEEEEGGGSILLGGGRITLPQAWSCGRQEGNISRVWQGVVEAAAKGPDGVAVLGWLQEQGAPPLHGNGHLVRQLLECAARAGRLDTCRYLLSVLSPTQRVLPIHSDICVVQSGNVEVAACLHQAGLALDDSCYSWAAPGGLKMVQWLATKAQVSAVGMPGRELWYMIKTWPERTPANSRDLLQAVQVVVEQAGFRDWEGFWGAGDKDWRALMKRGELALVQYLLRQRLGCRFPGGAEALEGAVDAGCEAMLEWLTAEHPRCLAGPWCVLGGSPYCGAAQRGDRATLAAMRRLGVQWGEEEVVVRAVQGKCAGPALRWLVEQGAPMGSAAKMCGLLGGSYWTEGLSGGEVEWLRGLVGAPEAVGGEKEGVGGKKTRRQTEEEEEEEGEETEADDEEGEEEDP